MQTYRIVHSSVHAAVAGLCWWVFQHLDQLQSTLADYKQYAIPALLAGLALLFRMSDALSKIIVEKIPIFSRLLRRILSGNSFIEGDWTLVVIDMEKGAPVYFGFLAISFRNGQPYVSGDDWHINGTHAHSFISMQSLYRSHTLQYWYEQGESLHAPNMRGYAEIFFFPKDKLALRHAGKFLDPKHTSDVRFYSRKLRHGLFEPRIHAKEKKIEAAKQLWLELEPQIDFLRGRPVSADFAA